MLTAFLLKHHFLRFFWSWYDLRKFWFYFLLLDYSLLHWLFGSGFCSFDSCVYLNSLQRRRGDNSWLYNYLRRNNNVCLNWWGNFVWNLMTLDERETYRRVQWWPKLNVLDGLLSWRYEKWRKRLSLIEIRVKNFIHSWTLKRGNDLNSNWNCFSTAI